MTIHHPSTLLIVSFLALLHFSVGFQVQNNGNGHFISRPSLFEIIHAHHDGASSVSFSSSISSSRSSPPNQQHRRLTPGPLFLGEADDIATTINTMSATYGSLSSGIILKMIGSSIDTFFQTNPFLSAFLTCSVKAGTADYVAQSKSLSSAAAAATATSDETTSADSTSTKLASSTTMSEEDVQAATICFQRNVAFIVYGGVYQGLFQELLYSYLFPAWFGTDPSFVTVAKQVALDMLVITPAICLPVAYIVKAIFTSDEPNLKDKITTFLKKYVDDVSQRGLLLKYWSIWVPAQSLTFSVIPQHFRVAFVAVVSFFWVFILSSISSAAESESAAASLTSSASEVEAAASLSSPSFVSKSQSNE